MIYNKLLLKRFKIGDLFEYYQYGSKDTFTKIGYVVGIILNDSHEVIFRVKFADDNIEQSLHPSLMKPLLDYIPGVNS